MLFRYNHLDLMGCVQDKIDKLDMDLKRKISTRQNDLKIAMSIPGIEFTSAATILAKIGNYRNFSSPEQLASYFGIVPFCKPICEQATYWMYHETWLQTSTVDHGPGRSCRFKEDRFEAKEVLPAG
jgi:hypothetical protein